MNTNLLKKFAREARTKLISQVEAKLIYVLNTDSAELRSKEKQIDEIRAQVKQLGKENFIEKIAYTWFNRFTALRFMDVNNHTFIGTVSPPEDFTLPEILSEAKKGHVDDRLRVDKDRINKLLDGVIPSKNPQSDVYKVLFIASCNYYSTILPFMFEKIEDYSELLLPDDLLTENSVLMNVVGTLTKEDCQDVEIIGWLYQFYISEKKDEVINAKAKYKTEEIPAATQLFTPHWIVKYIVQNTLGRMWLEARPNSGLREYMDFYIEPSDKGNIPVRVIKSPEDIKFLDPASGSAHILVYAFELFTKIYEEEGYDKPEIPKLILENNLFGLEIDERAATLGSFALTMKASQYYSRYLRSPLVPKNYVFEGSDEIPQFANAKTFGTLIRLTKNDYETMVVEDGSLFQERQKKIKDIGHILTQKYDCVVTNPPYVNSSYMNGILTNFVKTYYKETKTDLFACFLVRCRELTKPEGMIGYVSPFVWMFISSYEWLRNYIVKNAVLQNLIQLEYNAFEPACVPVCAFTLRNEFLDMRGDYIKLTDFRGYDNQWIKTLDAIHNPFVNYRYHTNQVAFLKIPGSPIAFWASQKLIDIFVENICLGEIAFPKQGIATADNERFLRFWNEVSISKTSLLDNIPCCEAKWFHYNKGGEYRKWFGNNEYIVNWGNDGEEIKSFEKSVIRNPSYFFKTGLTWTSLTISNFNIRFSVKNSIFDSKGPMLFNKEPDKIYYTLGLLNTSVVNNILSLLAPTMDYNQGPVSRIPFKYNELYRNEIDNLVKENIEISKREWDSRENSWDFKINELLRLKEDNLIKTSYKNYCNYWEGYFFKLKKNEEVLNNIFINIYGLQDEIRPSLDAKYISILKNEIEILNENHIKFNINELIKQFISYAVGCMFGRYSIDIDGLILADQGKTLKDYYKIIPMPSFVPDEDAIIPILEENYFIDDITDRFNEFLKVSFGEENFVENLAFIEDALGKDIRKYFTREFYADHIKRYNKRPIYWMFSSPKKSFNALIYMHRYQSDIISKILNDYLREFQEKLKVKKEQFTQITLGERASDSERNKAQKGINKIDSMLKELQEYEREILFPLAAKKIDIELDDGVKVNYNKFGKALQKVTGLTE